jgi:hypothetical protein
MNSLASKADAHSNCLRSLVIVPTVAALLLWVLNSSSRGQEARDARPSVTATATVQPTATAQPTRDFVDLLKFEAERSDKALQVYTDLLREEANRSEQATRHEIDVVERTLAKFIWIVGIVGTIISGVGAIVGGTLVYMGVGSVKDIERKVTNAANTSITAAKNAATSAFAKEIADVTAASGAASEAIKTMQGASQERFHAFESELGEQREDIQTIALLARSVLTKYQLEILQKLSKGASITTDTTDKMYYEGFKQDILRLRGVGFIENKKERSGLSDLEQSGGTQDARTYFQVTREGKRFLSLLERLPPPPSGC